MALKSSDHRSIFKLGHDLDLLAVVIPGEPGSPDEDCWERINLSVSQAWNHKVGNKTVHLPAERVSLDNNIHKI